MKGAAPARNRHYSPRTKRKSMENAQHAPAWLTAARQAMQIEGNAILAASGRLNEDFCRAVELVRSHPGKIVVTGIGKSGYVARKLAATLCSTGTPAVFLHAAEAGHGDLGVYSSGDPTLLISKSGATGELLRLLPMLREFRSPCIGIIGARNSPLGAAVDVVLDASVEREADTNGIVPTASAAVALAFGHALAIALMEAREFQLDDFGRFHPDGALGRGLNLTVRDVMHGGGEVAWVADRDSLKQVVIAMTRYPLGAACVVDAANRFAGLITDGDVRRALRAHDDIRGLCAADVMTRAPIAIGPDARLREALRLMEDRPSQISLLPVVDADGQRCLGLIRLHDIYRSSRLAGGHSG